MPDLHMKHWPPGVPTTLTVPDRTVAQNLAATAARVPDRTALIYYGARISYAALWHDVERIAGWLTSMGVDRGDRVVIDMQNGPQWIIAYYAILRADAAVVPANPMYRAAELDHILRDSGARIAIVGTELVDHLRPQLASGALDHLLAAACADMAAPEGRADMPAELRDRSDSDVDGPGITRWREALEAHHAPGPHAAGPDDLAVLLYTSGTTGQPKGCVHRHRNIQQVTHTYLPMAPYTDDTVILTVMPFFHVTGMQNGMNAPLAAGATLVQMTRWDTALALRLIERHRVTMWRSITAMVIDLMRALDDTPADISSLRLIGAGGAAVPEAVARRLHALTGLKIVEGYGMSETAGVTHMNPNHAPREQCLGIPVFDVDARVIDLDDGHELGPDKAGEIVIAAPQVFDGYWRNDAATAAAFTKIDGKRFLRTGDIGLYDGDGYFYMTDRLKRMINASGYKVWPAEVEALMHRHPDVAEACVVGLPDPRRGETVVAHVVRRSGAALDEAALAAWCRAEMAAYKVPHAIRFVPALPRSGTGKVQWREIAAAEADSALAATQDDRAAG
ncbi:long-chain-fatty-acid--CoA ligase [Pseudooceanicola sp. LIPI14-2-Ac024]|uniref:long-chain-fatty-acid--CoA ligase n=1 Tax=Pseudooceanicola sp. LIPI14-2-Ac024 TaxID=3344875 RepID=UPI0035CFE01C